MTAGKSKRQSHKYSSSTGRRPAGSSQGASTNRSSGGTSGSRTSTSRSSGGTSGSRASAGGTHRHKKPRKRLKMTRRQRQQKRRRMLIKFMLIILVILSFVMFKSCQRVVDLSKIDYPSYVTQDFIDVDGTSRTGLEMRRVNDIVIHYVANPGSTAQANRNYFDSDQSNVSAHFVVGLNGEVIQCVPLNEQSSASNKRNVDTVSIEVCHPDASGKFNQVSYDRLVELTAWLCSEFGLDEDDVIRHYDITGKNCPKYYVENEAAWEQFKEDVKKSGR